MRAYWRNCGYRHGNFGDEITPYVIESISGKFPEMAEDFESADIISIGSILNEVSSSYSGRIWGTGCMFNYSHGEFLLADVRAVRGKLSASRFKFSGSSLGDPGLLVDRLVKRTPKYDLAIVPHYADFNNLWLRGFATHNKVKIIDPCQPAMEVLSEIASARHLLSSGLHPLIAADSLGIPNGWIYLSDLLAGGDFKFRDYYSVFDITDVRPIPFDENSKTEFLISSLEKYSRPNINKIKQRLLESFPA